MSPFTSDDNAELEPLDGTVVTETQRTPETSVPMEIVRTVAEEEGVSSTDLPVLNDVVDPEALEDLIAGTDPDRRSDVRVSFRYCGYTVVVTADSVTFLSD